VTDVRTDAVGIAHGIFARRILSRLSPLLDVEELKQDLAVHVLANLKYYKPERGSLKTFVGMTFDNWWRQSIKDRTTRAANEESRWEMPEVEYLPTRSDLDMSAKAQAIIAELPEQTRDVAELHIAHGVPLPAVAELTGMTYPTAYGRLRRARRALRELAPV
jgi:RNA polymerase sigma factor (sigma-70 family)